MLEKLKLIFNNINETYYNIGFVILTILTGVLAIVCGFAAAEVIFGILIKGSIYTLASLGFIKALMGPWVDIKKEILAENNSALAILVAGFLIGLGFSIGGI